MRTPMATIQGENDKTLTLTWDSETGEIFADGEYAGVTSKTQEEAEEDIQASWGFNWGLEWIES